MHLTHIFSRIQKKKKIIPALLNLSFQKCFPECFKEKIKIKSFLINNKYITIIHMLPVTLGKISDKVLTMNIKKMCVSALDAM